MATELPTTETRLIALAEQSEKIRTFGRAGYKLTDAAYHRRWLERVKSRIVIDERGCWIWQGNRTLNGYGQIGYRSKTAILHRTMYEVHHGVKLGRWEYACHSCDKKLCCNPEHLWKGTPKDNQFDCIQKRRNSEQNITHCPRGHEYTEENTYRGTAASGRPSRNCKACQRIRSRLSQGWTLEQAMTLPTTPPGQRPVAGRKVA